MKPEIIMLERLEDIPSIPFQGYIWMSDEHTGRVYRDEHPDISQIGTNPFIVEGHLFSEEKGISVSIAHVNGVAKIAQVQWNSSVPDHDDEQYTVTEYLPNPVLEIDKLKFATRWEDTPDPFCENMNVLKPAWTAFIGFDDKEEN